VGFLLQRATPANRAQILNDASAALGKVRDLVRAQFAAIPPRDVLRYNKSIGWSHQEFVEAWGLWLYVQGARAPSFSEFDSWLNHDGGGLRAATIASEAVAEAPAQSDASAVLRM
jgi:hypothetical protein